VIECEKQRRIEATASLRRKWTWPCCSMLWDENHAFGLPLEAPESWKCFGPLMEQGDTVSWLPRAALDPDARSSQLECTQRLDQTQVSTTLQGQWRTPVALLRSWGRAHLVWPDQVTGTFVMEEMGVTTARVLGHAPPPSLLVLGPPPLGCPGLRPSCRPSFLTLSCRPVIVGLGLRPLGYPCALRLRLAPVRSRVIVWCPPLRCRFHY